MAVTTGQPDAPAYAIDDLLADGDLTGVAWCEARTARTDAYLLALYGAAGSPAGTALVALGGYGRGDLCPESDLDVALVESRQRKCDAVERIVATMGLANARVLRGRLNELLRSHTDLEHGHDLVVCRAVGSLEDVLRTAYPALAPNGVLVMWKSDPLDPDEERAGEARAARLGCERLDDLVHDAYKPSRLVRYRRPGETS